MDAVLSVQGASAPVKKKSFFSKFTRLNMLRLARAVIPAAVLMMFFPQLAMAANRPDEAAPLQAFGEEAQSVTVSPQHFYLVTPASAEDEQVSGERVILQDVLNF